MSEYYYHNTTNIINWYVRENLTSGLMRKNVVAQKYLHLQYMYIANEFSRIAPDNI